MSTPGISTDSTLAHALASTLSVNVSRLDDMDGRRDNTIRIHALKKNALLKNRIFSFAARPGVGICENAFLVDNGDGKIGNGDLFLHADGFYRRKGTGKYAFRFAKLFEQRNLQNNHGAAAAASEDLPVRVNSILLKPIEARKGELYREVLKDPLFQGICTIVRQVNLHW